MTAEELAEMDHRFAAHEDKVQSLVASFAERLDDANKIMSASEDRQKAEADLYNKRAAEHDAQEKAQHERATAALDLQRRNVEAWERIASALERLVPFPSIFSQSFQPSPFSPCLHVNTEFRTDGCYCTVCGQRVGT